LYNGSQDSKRKTVSEYQYYEFQAIDRPLTEGQMRELRSVSSRADITPTRFANFYTFGNFKGDPAKMVEKYFDAYLYLANWGTHEFTLRFPRQALDLERAQLYCAGESASARAKGEYVILDFSSQDEDGDWEDEGQGWLSSLIPLRADIASGDDRALYLAWLLCAQNQELEDDITEPPCPPGLSQLSAPLRAFADFLRVDDDLIEVAAAGSPPLVELSLGEDFEQWVSALPDSDKTALLVQLVREGETHVRGQLLRRFRPTVENTDSSGTSASPRTVADLLALAERHGEERRRKEAERQARERARREREAAAAREKYLEGLAQREPEVWAKVDTLIATKRPGDYDQAVQLLKDLWDLGVRSGRSPEIQARILRLQDQHVKKPSFMRRLAECGLAPPPSDERVAQRGIAATKRGS
jgi:hypothetical protein